METFVSTSDGKFPCLRYKGELWFGTADDLAKKYGITEYVIDLDPQQTERDKKDALRLRLRQHNANLEKPWGY